VYGAIKNNAPVFVDAKCFEQCLPSTLEVTNHDVDDLLGVNQQAQVQTVLLASPDQKATERMQNNFNYIYPHISDVNLPLKSSVTKELALSNDEQNSLQHYLLDGEDTTDIERGLIAHKLLEYFDFDAKLSVKEQAQKLVEGGVLTQLQLEKISLERIQKVFDSGVFANVKNAYSYREKSFISGVDASLIDKDSVTDQKVVVQGVIDLLVVTPQGAQIIDYKYSGKGAERLRETYAPQLRLYRMAAAKALKIPEESIRCTLVNINLGYEVEIN
jgi:ATP-dependent exoDNAse (exonuclease V) beta subunit